MEKRRKKEAFSETATLASDSVPTNNATVVPENARITTDTPKVATSSVETTAKLVKKSYLLDIKIV